jgi:hypothetical protein
MPDYLYRFRTTDKLLGDGYQELEKQEIYFSLPEELNDPMEGFLDISWSGDEIVWTNLLRNYLLCLERLCLRYAVQGEAAPLGVVDISAVEISGSETPLARELLNEALTLFLQQSSVADWPKHFASRSHPIRRNELQFFFNLIHPHAIRVVLSVFKNRGLIPDDKLKDDGFEQLSRILTSGTEILSRSHELTDDQREKIYAVINALSSSVV